MSKTILSILAGGLSRRFQTSNIWKDKALIEIDSKPHLINLLEDASSIYSEMCISVNSKNRQREYEAIISKYNPSLKPKFIIDKKIKSFKGAFLGIVSVMDIYKENEIQFIPSDRPFLELQILKKLQIDKNGVSLLEHDTGIIEPLLALYGTNQYLPKEFQNLNLNRADVLIRTASIIRTYNINQILDSNDLPSYIFDNVNIQTDFEKKKKVYFRSEEMTLPKPHLIYRSPPKELVHYIEDVNFVDFLNSLIETKNLYSSFLWLQYLFNKKLISKEQFHSLGKETLHKEYEFWIKNDMPFLALHALQDLIIYFPQEKKSSVSLEILRIKNQLGINKRV